MKHDRDPGQRFTIQRHAARYGIGLLLRQAAAASGQTTPNERRYAGGDEEGFHEMFASEKRIVAQRG
jgi:hypothetical protein